MQTQAVSPEQDKPTDLQATDHLARAINQRHPVIALTTSIINFSFSALPPPPPQKNPEGVSVAASPTPLGFCNESLLCRQLLLLELGLLLQGRKKSLLFYDVVTD